MRFCSYLLGSVYARALHKKPRPRVGVLSNGEEAMKGTELTRNLAGLRAALSVAARPAVGE